MKLSMVASSYTQKLPSHTRRVIFSSILAGLGFVSSSENVLAAVSTLTCPFNHTSGFTTPASEEWHVTSSEIVEDENYNPVRTFSGYMVNQSIVEDGDTLYIAYFDQNKIASVAKKVGSGKWSIKSLGVPVEYDSHSNIAIAVDTSHNLHVVAYTNLDDKNLKYWVTSQPGNLQTLTRASMIPKWGETINGVFTAYEQIVTYPRFYKGPDDRLFFRYRAGSSGGAWTIVYRYDASNKTWQLLDPNSTPTTSGLAKVFAGYNSIPQMSAYPSIPAKGPDGNYHMVWTWRADPTAGTNSQIHYSYSTDLLVWKNIKGEIVPGGQFVYNLQSTMVDNVPQHGGVLNDSGIAHGFDAAGNVVVSYFKYVGSGATKTTQLFIARPTVKASANGWDLTQVSNWNGLYDLESGLIDSNILTANEGAKPDGRYFSIDYICQSVIHRMYIDPSTSTPVADIRMPAAAQMPLEIQTSSFPPMTPPYQITFRTAFSETSTNMDSLMLKWEAGPYIVNGQINALGPYPLEGSPLTLFRMTK